MNANRRAGADARHGGGNGRRRLAHACLVTLLVVGGLVVATAEPAFAAARTWTGTTSTEWNLAANWGGSPVPTAADDATIPAGLTNYPVVSTAAANAKTVTLTAGA